MKCSVYLSVGYGKPKKWHNATYVGKEGSLHVAEINGIGKVYTEKRDLSIDPLLIIKQRRTRSQEIEAKWKEVCNG